MCRAERKGVTMLWCVFALFVTIMVAGDAGGDPIELAIIREVIKEKAAKWIANETHVSKLDSVARKKRLGLIRKGDELFRGFLPEQDRSHDVFLSGVPSSFDWRNVEGQSYVTPVKDQGNCGSCWAFAVTAALESQYMIAMGLSIDLSEQTLVSCSGAGSCDGGYVDEASDFVKNVGLPTESCFPYRASDEPCSSVCRSWFEASHRVNDWFMSMPTSSGLQEIKNTLFNYGPVVAGMAVYEDFYYYSSGIYSYTWGRFQGYHAVLIVGYDDTDQYFIVKNSWGTDWGEEGFFRIAYSEMTGHTEFAFIFYGYRGYAGDFPPWASCTYYLSPYKRVFKAQGGRGVVSVYTSPNCFWFATVSESWLRIIEEGAGFGSGRVQYYVQRNTGAARTAYITIGDRVHTVTQQSTTRLKR